MQPIQGIKEQDKLQQKLEVALGETIGTAIDKGIHPDRVLAALKKVLGIETSLALSRAEDARSY